MFSGEQSTLAPQSQMQTLPFLPINTQASAGLICATLPKINILAAKTTPVAPQDTYALQESSSLHKVNAFTKDEFGFCLMIFVGISLLVASSVQ